MGAIELSWAWQCAIRTATERPGSWVFTGTMVSTATSRCKDDERESCRQLRRSDPSGLRRIGEANGASAVDIYTVHQTADVDETAVLGPSTTVWHLAQIRENARLGHSCIVGRGAYVGPGVVIGNNVKLQNYALVYEPAWLEDSVFIGPAAVLTNDLYPRSTDVTGKLKRTEDWEAMGVVAREGASIGARAVIVAGCVIGRWALVAAGAVVTHDVPDFALSPAYPRGGWGGSAGSASGWYRLILAVGVARKQANSTRKRRRPRSAGQLSLFGQHAPI